MDKASDSGEVTSDNDRRRFLAMLGKGAIAVTAGLSLPSLRADISSLSSAPVLDEIGDVSAINHFRAFHSALGLATGSGPSTPTSWVEPASS